MLTILITATFFPLGTYKHIIFRVICYFFTSTNCLLNCFYYIICIGIYYRDRSTKSTSNVHPIIFGVKCYTL